MLNFSSEPNYTILPSRFEEICGVDVTRRLACESGFIKCLRGLQPDLLVSALLTCLIPLPPSA